ncbi:MAG: tripartite tricarboxylate transporter substrate binding protein [Betaproteobacteria bacterium]|jgi:tripartite-type tricarboxylate transporter receptor subunit TctC|nr:tripartite tricarboxylate transporter substrate binding protein [Betaproteobacteria bacterium]
MRRAPSFAALISLPLAIGPTLAGSGLASAQSFPSKQVRIVVPFPAGGTGDVVARMVAAPLSKSLGQPVIVDNRAGGGTVIGTELVARSAPDGHTLLTVFNSFTINPAVRPKLPYDTEKDFAAVTLLAQVPFVYAVHPSLPVKSLKDLVALARAKPGALTYATPGPGTGQHLAAEMLKLMAGIDITHIPYQGAAPAVTAVLGGHTTVLVVNVSDVTPYSSVGRLRPLAVTTRERSAAMKDVPSVAEVGFPEYESALWVGLVAPGATPKDTVARLSTEVGRVLQLPDVVAGLDKLGLSGAPRTPEQFTAFIRDELRRNESTARKANIRVE